MATTIDPNRADPETATRLRAASELERTVASLAERWMAADDDLLGLIVGAAPALVIEAHHTAAAPPAAFADELAALGVPVEQVTEPFGRARYRELRDEIFALHETYTHGAGEPDNPFVGLAAKGIDVVAAGFDDRHVRLLFVVRDCTDALATRERVAQALHAKGIDLPGAVIDIRASDAANPTATTANG